MPGEAGPIDAMTVLNWLQQFLRRESGAVRVGYGLAIAGHVIIMLLLMFGAFERIHPASAVVTIPVEIVMEKPEAQTSQPPPAPPKEPTPAPSPPPPSLPVVADADKRAKAPVATLDVNGIDLPKQPGRDGSDKAGSSQPSADGELASGAVSIYREMAVAPIGPAPPQTTTSEPGEDELTAIKEEKHECGLNAKVVSRTRAMRSRGKVLGFFTDAQGLAQTRSSQVLLDRNIDPHYLGNQQVLAEALDGAGKGSVVLPAGFKVNEGDVIDIDLAHVDPLDPCHYIPNVAVSRR